MEKIQIDPIVVALYSDAVVTFHQFKQDLGLTAPEARVHPDTLGVYFELSNIVHEIPEIAVAYTGVCKFRGEKKQVAIDNVRTIEEDILIMLRDQDVISDAAFKKQRDIIATDEGVRQRSETFVKLFKGVLQPDMLPKPRKPKTRKIRADNEVDKKPEIVAQDSVFRVVIDQDDTIVINDKVPLLFSEARIILSELLKEANSDKAFVAPSYLRRRQAWKIHVQENPEASPRLFSKGMRELKQALTDKGLTKFILQDGTGSGTSYKLNLHSFKTTQDQAKKPQGVEQPDKIDVPEPATDPSDFSQALLDWIKQNEKNIGTQGLRKSYLASIIAHRLKIDKQEAEDALRSLRESDNLHQINRGGNVFLTTAPVENAKSKELPTKPDPIAEAEKLQEEIDNTMKIADELVDQLLALDHANQGLTFKTLWAQTRISGVLEEAEYKRAVRRIESHGLVEIRVVRASRGSHRDVRVPKVHISSQATKDALQTNKAEEMDKLREELSEPIKTILL